MLLNKFLHYAYKYVSYNMKISPNIYKKLLLIRFPILLFNFIITNSSKPSTKKQVPSFDKKFLNC